jgi:hypothetical protein
MAVLVEERLGHPMRPDGEGVQKNASEVSEAQVVAPALPVPQVGSEHGGSYNSPQILPQTRDGLDEEEKSGGELGQEAIPIIGAVLRGVKGRLKKVGKKSGEREKDTARVAVNIGDHRRGKGGETLLLRSIAEAVDVLKPAGSVFKLGGGRRHHPSLQTKCFQYRLKVPTSPGTLAEVCDLGEHLRVGVGSSWLRRQDGSDLLDFLPMLGETGLKVESTDQEVPRHSRANLFGQYTKAAAGQGINGGADQVQSSNLLPGRGV